MTKELIETYDFAEDAMGFGDFITSAMGSLPDDEIVVLVENDKGEGAVSASFVRETLTDGSTVVNLVIKFA